MWLPLKKTKKFLIFSIALLGIFFHSIALWAFPKREIVTKTSHENSRGQFALRSQETNSSQETLTPQKALSSGEGKALKTGLLLKREQDLGWELILKGREAYRKGQFLEAQQSYLAVPRDSYWWMVSLEELAWLHYRHGNWEEALAYSINFLGSPLKDLGFYEGYLIKALSHLKLCQYGEVMKTLEEFKEANLPRIEALEALAQRRPQDLQMRWIKNHLGRVPDSHSLKPYLPISIVLDQKLHKKLRSVNLSQALDRLSELAKEELDEVKRVTQLLRLVQADSKQRLIRDLRVGNQIQDGKRFERVDYQHLIFPFDPNWEAWPDEIGNFQVSSDFCKPKRRAL